MARHRKWLVAAVVLAVSLLSYAEFTERRSRAAQHELSLLLPKIEAITIYDLSHGESFDSQALALATSAPFSRDVFMRAAGAAKHHGGITIWKGSSLAVLTLQDGTQRHARFSYYGNFFALDGIPGRFVIPESAGFQDTFLHLIQERFVPKRVERNQKNEA